MKIGTLFSGIGAPEQGAKRVYGDDLELVFACEYDKFARQSFETNYEIEDKHYHVDINDMDGKQYKDKVDIIIGGSPCQAFSIAGLREGLNDKRGQLIWQYYRIIMEASPEIFIYENVKGMVSDNAGQTLKNFLDIFRQSGYFCHQAVLNTKDYGVPQNRERIFIVGFKDADLYHRFQFAPKIKLEKRLKDVLEDEVDEKYYLSDKIVKNFIHGKSDFNFEPHSINDEYSKCLTARYQKIGRTDPYIKVEGMLGIKGTDQIRRVYGVDGVAATLTTMQGGNQEPKIQVKSATKSGYETATTGDSINLTHPDSKTRRGRVGVGVGVGQTLDCQCLQATIIKKEYYEKSTLSETNTDKKLWAMWDESKTEAFKKWGTRIFTPLQQENILQSRLQGKEFSEDWGHEPVGLNSTQDSKKYEETFYRERLLREVWIEWETRYSSYRRKLPKQQYRKLDGFMQKLSSFNSQQTRGSMHNEKLQHEDKSERILQQTLSEIQNLWKCTFSEEAHKDREQNYRIRKLTPRETLRLQDFHDTFKQVVSNSQQYKQAGNSMSVNVLEMIFRQIEKAKENVPTNTLLDFL